MLDKAGLPKQGIAAHQGKPTVAMIGWCSHSTRQFGIFLRGIIARFITPFHFIGKPETIS